MANSIVAGLSIRRILQLMIVVHLWVEKVEEISNPLKCSKCSDPQSRGSMSCTHLTNLLAERAIRWQSLSILAILFDRIIYRVVGQIHCGHLYTKLLFLEVFAAV